MEDEAGIGTYLSDSTDDHKEVRWDFVYDSNDRVAYEAASDPSILGITGHILYAGRAEPRQD